MKSPRGPGASGELRTVEEVEMKRKRMKAASSRDEGLAVTGFLRQ